MLDELDIIETPSTEELPSSVPLLAVRDLVVFPLMIVPLQVTRAFSARAIREAMAQNRLIMVVAQKVADENEPTEEGLYLTGTLSVIMRLKDQDETKAQVVLQGLLKAKIKNISKINGHYQAEIDILPETERAAETLKEEALLRLTHENMHTFSALVPKLIGPDIMLVIDSLNEAGKLADLIAAYLGLNVSQAEELLEKSDPWERLAKVGELLNREIAVRSLQNEIQSQINSELKSSQRQYILEQQLERIKAELGQKEKDGVDELSDRLLEIALPEGVRKEAEKELKLLRKMNASSAEASVIYNYISMLMDYPWFIMSCDNVDIAHAREVLNSHHAYLDLAKERVLEYLAVRRLKGQKEGAILCFLGPPGVGKTSLGYAIGAALGRKVVRIALGGVNDEAEIRGHRRTYVGAMPGRIVQAIMQAGTANPLIILDEIDKLAGGLNGNPAAALLEVLDQEQNHSFHDHYFNVPIDLSRLIFVATANQLDTLPPALRDRLEIVEFSGYSLNEKVEIARRFIVPEALRENGLTSDDLLFSTALLKLIISGYTKEAGCRSLKRRISAICRKQALLIAEEHNPIKRLTATQVAKILGPPPFGREEADKENRVGVIKALAWTPAGGEILPIEAAAIEGENGLILTGQLGSIMKESAQIALSFVHSHFRELDIPPRFFAGHEIHIHVPAAAMPKDGPSAGLAMAICLASLASGKPISANLAVTGEISLSGHILPIGGLKEKILAARRAQIKKILFPAQNMDELAKIFAGEKRPAGLTAVDDLLSAIKLVLG